MFSITVHIKFTLHLNSHKNWLNIRYCLGFDDNALSRYLSQLGLNLSREKMDTIHLMTLVSTSQLVLEIKKLFLLIHVLSSDFGFQY